MDLPMDQKANHNSIRSRVDFKLRKVNVIHRMIEEQSEKLIRLIRHQVYDVEMSLNNLKSRPKAPRPEEMKAVQNQLTGCLEKFDQIKSFFCLDDSRCEKSLTSELNHQLMFESEDPDDTEEVTCAYLTESLEVNSAVLIKVTAVSDPCNFYAILPFDKEKVEKIEHLPLILRDEICSTDHPQAVNEQRYKELASQLRAHYLKLCAREKNSVVHTPDAPVVVRCEETGQFIRGKVIETDSRNKIVTILDVDSGKIVRSKVSSTFKLLPYFCHLPALAMKFSLARLNQTTHNAWRDDSMHFFKQLTLNRHFVAHVISKSNKIFVELVGTSSGEDVVVSEVLSRNEPANSVLTSNFTESQDLDETRLVELTNSDDEIYNSD